MKLAHLYRLTIQRLVLTLLVGASLVWPAVAEVRTVGATGATWYARIEKSNHTFFAVQMAEDTGHTGGAGNYIATDAQILTAATTLASGDYTVTVRPGTASASADDTAIGSGVLHWNGTRELTEAEVVAAAAATAVAGGPIEQRGVANGRILEVYSRTDGSFGVKGKVRMAVVNGHGESHQLWALEYKGTQLPVGGALYGMSAPTAAGANAAHLTVDDYGVDHTQAKVELTLSDSASSSDVITLSVPVNITATETVIVSVPVQVGG